VQEAAIDDVENFPRQRVKFRRFHGRSDLGECRLDPHRRKPIAGDFVEEARVGCYRLEGRKDGVISNPEIVAGSFVGEQLHSLTTSVSKVLQYLRRFSMELNKPKARWDEKKIRAKIQRWLSGQFLTDVIHYELHQRDGPWHLQFDFNIAAWQRLLTHRLGRTVLLTNRMDWTAEQVATGYSGQYSIERVFRGLKDGEWLGWGPAATLTFGVVLTIFEMRRLTANRR
jgi:hypothetical protein